MNLQVPILATALLAPGALASAQHHHHQGDAIQTVCGVEIALGTPCPTGQVAVPPGWHSGDTHEHIQQCFNPVDTTTTDIYTEMQATGLDVSSPLIWSAGFITPDQYKTYTANFVTGSEDLTTVGDPTKIIQFGVETSGVNCGNLGHMIGLNIGFNESDIFKFQLGCQPIYPAPGWKNDGSGDYSKPIFDLFKTAPDAVTGYAHQSWPVNLYEPVGVGGFDWEDPLLPAYVGFDAKCSFGQTMAFPLPKTCGNTHPVLAPFDVAMNRCDFLEAFELENATCSGDPVEKRWFGMYYKLLNSGMRLGVTAGSDADCIGLLCPPRAYALLEDGEPFNYDTWTKAVKNGRTSLAVGPYQFLEIDVDGMDPGEQVDLETPVIGSAMVNVTATYHVNITDATQVTDVIEIVQDGVVVASLPFGPISMGTAVFNVDVPVTRSGWIAARTQSYSTHTAAVYTELDRQPVANCADAEYWTLYADFLNYQLDLAALTSQAALEFFVGCSETEIRDYVAEGRDVFAAVRDYDATPPTGITRYGVSSPPDCTQPIGLVTEDTPVVGQSFRMRYFNAPPGASGALIPALNPIPTGLPFLGAEFYVLINPAIIPVPTTANDAGFGETTIPSLPNPAGALVYVQYVWFNPTGCDSTGLLSSSDALKITLQP